MPTPLQFHLLGPVRAWRDGSEINLGSPQQRATLAVLLLRGGRSASLDDLVAAMWTDNPPRTAIGTVRTYIYRLRQVLDGGDRQEDHAGPARPGGTPEAGSVLVSWTGGGYAVAAGLARVDLDDFRELTTRAAVARRDGDRAGAAELLRAALALWKDEPLAGLSSTYLDRQRARLIELRLNAIEDRIEVDLELARHAEVAGELAALVAEHPLRERFSELLMVALYRSGRQAEALSAYHRVRRVLTEQLGVEPGAGLRSLQERILRADPDLLPPPTRGAITHPVLPGPGSPIGAARPDDGHPVSGADPAAVLAAGGPPSPGEVTTPGAASAPTAPPPAELPGDVSGFAGRDAELATLDRLGPAGSGTDRTGSTIIVLSGAAGAGKTALAVHWGHRVTELFPDGQLYVNLLGYAQDPPMRSLDALARFLRALGTPREQVPDDVEEASARYRSLLARRRVLIMLDNAHDSDQVRPLLPGGPGCCVVVTSRDALGSLVAAHGARSIPVRALTRTDSLALLADLLGPDLAVARTDDAAELARLCDDLPLALRIVAANILRSPGRSVAGQVQRLRSGDRMAELAVDGDDRATVRVAYDLSYAALPPATGRMFRLLSLAPGSDIAVDSAAAMAGVTRTEASRALRQLTSRHLIVELSPGRYGWHDLLRLHAVQRAHAEDPEPDRAAATDRLFRYYLGRTDAATQRLCPQAFRLPSAPDRAGTARAGDAFTDHAAASAWLEQELPNLVATIEHAARNGPHPIAWLLGDALRGYFFLTRDAVAWRTTADAGLRAGLSAGDLAGEAAMRLSLGILAWAQDRYAEMVDEGTRALELARRCGWSAGEANALALLGNAQLGLGTLPAAAEHLRAALAIDLRTDDAGGQALRLSTLGVISHRLGRLGEAAAAQRAALAVERRLGTASGQASTLANLAETQLALGQPAAASESLAEALRLSRSVGDRAGESQLGTCIGQLRHAQGRHSAARELARTAAASARDAGDVQYEIEATITLARAQRALGDHAAAAREWARAAELADGVGSRYQHVEALIGLGPAHAYLGQDGLALDHARTAVTVARRDSYVGLAACALTALAEVHLLADRNDEAVRIATTAATGHHETGHRPGAVTTDLVLAHAYDRLDQPNLAIRHAEQARAQCDEMGVPVPADRYQTVDGPGHQDRAEAQLS